MYSSSVYHLTIHGWFHVCLASVVPHGWPLLGPMIDSTWVKVAAFGRKMDMVDVPALVGR